MKEEDMIKKFGFAVAALLAVVSLVKGGYFLSAFEPDGTTPYNGHALDINDTLILTVAAADTDANELPYFVVIADANLASITGGTINIPPAPEFSMIIEGSASDNLVNDLGSQDGIIGTVVELDLPPYPDGVYVTDIQFQCKGTGDVLVSLISLPSDNFSIDPEQGAVLLSSIIIRQSSETVVPHSVLVYRIHGNPSGFIFDSNVNTQALLPFNEKIRGYIVADVNISKLHTNYFASNPSNDPTFIAVSTDSFTILGSDDPNITTAFDMVIPDDVRYQKFNLLKRTGEPENRSLIRPQFTFIYNSDPNTVVMDFYDTDLHGYLHQINIGTPPRKTIPRYIRGKAVYDIGVSRHAAGSIALDFDAKYTRLANRKSMNVSAVVDVIANDLQKKGFSRASTSAFFAK
jgi:hypothetical protein